MEDGDSRRAAQLLDEIADLLDRYDVHERAAFVRSIGRASPIAWDVVAGLKFWGGSGAVWEVEPFMYSHPDDPRSIEDTRRFQVLMIEVSDILEAMDLGSRSRRNADLFRRELGGT